MRVYHLGVLIGSLVIFFVAVCQLFPFLCVGFRPVIQIQIRITFELKISRWQFRVGILILGTTRKISYEDLLLIVLVTFGIEAERLSSTLRAKVKCISSEIG